MKNKKLTIIFLIAAVVLIWGVILFKIFNKASVPNSKQSGIIPAKLDEKKELKAYALLLNYPDPFFPGKRIKKKDSVVKKSFAKKKVKRRFPVIKYNGYLCSDQAERGHFSYNGKSLILSRGDSIATNICLQELFMDSVLISFHHEKKWFFR